MPAMRTLRGALEGTDGSAGKVHGKGETPLEPLPPRLSPPNGDSRSRQEQRRNHNARHHQKLDKKEHEGNPNNDFHVGLPTGPEPAKNSALPPNPILNWSHRLVGGKT